MTVTQPPHLQTSRMAVLPGNASHPGRRAEQQDCLGFTRFDNRDLIAHGGILAVVADGMGGFVGGAAASRSAVAAMRACYESKADWEAIPDALLRCLGRANRAVCEVAAGVDHDGHCGTTLLAAVIHSATLYWIGVGDSRLYLLRDGHLLCLTNDHTREQELEREVRAGRLSEREKCSDPQLTALVSWLGLRDLPQIGRNEHGVPLRGGERLLLCTDGLYRALAEQEIAELLCSGDPQDAAQALLAAAIAKDLPTQDNLTVVVLGVAG
jgi:serine/threonine protein phosphatase PrpC